MNKYMKSLNDVSEKVSGKLAYCVARNIRKLKDELIEFENMRNEYICKHGEVDENGNYFIKIDSDEYVKFCEFINELMNIEHEVDIMNIEKEELFKSTLNANEILELEFMINTDGM
jgi:hypothetical protein